MLLLFGRSNELASEELGQRVGDEETVENHQRVIQRYFYQPLTSPRSLIFSIFYVVPGPVLE